MLFALLAVIGLVFCVELPPTSTLQMVMQYSAAAYCPSTITKQTFTCGSRCNGIVSDTNLTLSITDKKSQTAGYVGFSVKNKIIVVIFRGTESIQSALVDIQFWNSSPKKFQFNFLPDNARLHFGFAASYLTVQNQVQKAIAALAITYPDYEILFGGHSLGGGITVLAATDFAFNFPSYNSRIKIYTFGKPRIGNLAFATYVLGMFPDRNFRIVRRGDPVPHLPPTFINYYHTGRQVQLTEKNATTLCNTAGPGGESPEVSFE